MLELELALLANIEAITDRHEDKKATTHVGHNKGRDGKTGRLCTSRGSTKAKEQKKREMAEVWAGLCHQDKNDQPRTKSFSADTCWRRLVKYVPKIKQLLPGRSQLLIHSGDDHTHTHTSVCVRGRWLCVATLAPWITVMADVGDMRVKMDERKGTLSWKMERQDQMKRGEGKVRGKNSRGYRRSEQLCSSPKHRLPKCHFRPLKFKLRKLALNSTSSLLRNANVLRIGAPPVNRLQSEAKGGWIQRSLHSNGRIMCPLQ